MENAIAATRRVAALFPRVERLVRRWEVSRRGGRHVIAVAVVFRACVSSIPVTAALNARGEKEGR